MNENELIKIPFKEFSLLIYATRENIRKELILSDAKNGFNPDKLEGMINDSLKITPEAFKIFEKDREKIYEILKQMHR
jgi:hypothetical protein